MARTSSVLQPLPGIVKLDFPRGNIVTVTFDDEKTSGNEIISALRRGGLPPEGKPVYLP